MNTNNQPENPQVSVKYPNGRHPNSLKNLKPYPKGKNGNSNPGVSLTYMLKWHLKKHPELMNDIIKSSIQGAVLREPVPFKEVWDRVDGKVPGDIPPGYADNRVINIIVASEKARGLIDGVNARLSPVPVPEQAIDVIPVEGKQDAASTQ